MAFQEKIDQLVAKLTDLTETGRLAWEETAEEGTFLASVGKFVVTLGEEGPNWPRYRFRILDAAGRMVDEAVRNLDDEDRDRLQQLHELARRKALNVEEALSDLLSSLERR